jgi:hypothetical protein
MIFHGGYFDRFIEKDAMRIIVKITKKESNWNVGKINKKRIFTIFLATSFYSVIL